MPSMGKKFYPFEGRRAFVSSLLVSFVIVFGLACVVAFKSYTKAIEATIHSNKTRATLLAKLILEHQRAAMGVLQSYADRPELVQKVKKKDFEGTVKELADLVKDNPEMDWPFISGPDSIVWVNYPVDRQTMGKDLSYRDWYKGVSNGWKPYISGVYKLIVGEKDLAVAVSVPIFDERGKVIGVLSCAQSTSFFQKIIREVGLNLDAKITLIDKEGHIIYSNRFPYTKEIVGYPPLESVKSGMKGEKGNVKVRDASDRDRIKYVSLAPVEGIGWLIIVEKARYEVLRSEYLYLALIGVISLLIYGIAALSLIYLRERHRQIRQLERLNEELDARVRERTAELETRNEALRESEGRFRALANATFEGIVESEAGRILDCNERFAEMMGCTVTEARGTAIADLIAPEDRDRVLANIQPNRESVVEHGMLRKDGTKLIVEAHGRPVAPGSARRYTAVRDITERKRAEEALKRSEEKYRDLIKYAPTGIYEIDFRTPRFSSVNDVMCQYLGYSREELLRMNPAEMMDGENASLFRERIRRQLIGEKIDDSVEYRVRAKDGREYDAILHITFTYEGGKPKGAMVIAHDITDRKRAEEALRENQALLSTIIESTPDPVYVKDQESRIVMANRALAKVVGKPIEEILGKTDSEYYGDLGTGQVLREHDLRVMESGQNEVTEETVPTSEGYRTFLSSKTPYRNASGDIIGITGISRDITEFRQAEEALRQSEAHRQVAEAVEAERRRLYDVLETLPAMVCLLTPDHHVPFANRSFREKFGESNGRHCYEFCFGQPQACEFCESYEVLKTGKPHHWEVTTPDGNTIIDAYDFPFTDVDGSPLILEMDIDITDRKRAEQELKEKARELAKLSSQLVSAQENERKRVSYDLHDNVWQALLAIRFNIENLFSSREDWEALSRKSKEVTEDILGVVGKIRSMQGDLWPYVLDDIGIRATIDWYCREFQKGHSGLTIESHVDFGEREIPSSARIVIYRVMQEAMSNVAKHSQAKHVSLSLVNTDHRVEFAIVDNGIGFDPEEILTKRALWGGLGLLSIKARTELSGGTFGIESVKGKGTTVRATWPV